MSLQILIRKYAASYKALKAARNARAKNCGNPVASREGSAMSCDASKVLGSHQTSSVRQALVPKLNLGLVSGQKDACKSHLPHGAPLMPLYSQDPQCGIACLHLKTYYCACTIILLLVTVQIHRSIHARLQGKHAWPMGDSWYFAEQGHLRALSKVGTQSKQNIS